MIKFPDDSENVHVVEIAVEARSEDKPLYRTKHGEVFVRRDGSVQGPLKTAEVEQLSEVSLLQREVSF